MLLRALFLRPAKGKPIRLGVTVLGVAVGVAAVVATVSANRAAVASLRRGVEAVAGPAVLEVTKAGGLPERTLAALRPLADEAVVAPVVEEIALLPALGDAVRVLGIDPFLEARLGEDGPDAGTARIPLLLSGDAVLLPEPLARRLALDAGDTIVLATRSRPRTLTVAAIFPPPPPAGAWERVVLMDVAAAQELFGRVGQLDRIELRPRAGAALEPLAAKAAALLSAGMRIAEPASRGRQASRMVRALDFNLTALSGISLLVAGVLVATTLATSVVQRRSAVALLRSLGASPAQLTGAVLAEAAVIGAAGGVLGVAGGAVGARAALASVQASVAAVVQGVPPTSITLDLDVALGGFLLAVVVSLAAALEPLCEVLHTPPIQGLRWERPGRLAAAHMRRTVFAAASLLLIAAALTKAPPVDGLPLAALGASLAVLGAVLVIASPAVDRLAAATGRVSPRSARPAVRLAGAALSAGHKRAAWAAGAVGITVGLAVAVTVMVHSFRVTVVDWSAQALRSDVWIRPLAASTGFGVGRLDPEIVAIARDLFGPAAVDPFYTTSTSIEGLDVTLGAGAMAVIAPRGGVPFRSGEDSRAVFRRTAATGGAVVNEPFANRTGLGEGDVVRIETPRGVIRRTINGVFYDYSRQEGMVVIDAADYLAHFPDDGPREVGLFLPPGSDPAAAREALRERLGGRFLVEAFLNRELRREVVAIFDRTFAITAALRLVAASVAVIAVVTVLFALLAERRRDLAVLRTLGGSRGQILALVLAESALLGATGVILGLASGLAVGVVLVKVVNLQSFAWTLRFVVPWPSLAATSVWLFMACVVSGIAPALAAMRVVPGEELRDEG